MSLWEWHEVQKVSWAHEEVTMKTSSITKDDVIAGLSGAIAGTPQAMGFALIAGYYPTSC
jgi:MFS superfamily sulfate permease-like transporter